MSLFRLDASIRVEGSHSREIADIVEQEWRTAYPHSQVVTRHIGVDPIPATAWSTAVHATFLPVVHRSAEQVEALNLAAEVAGELIDAEACSAVLGGKCRCGGLLYQGTLQDVLDEQLEIDQH